MTKRQPLFGPLTGKKHGNLVPDHTVGLCEASCVWFGLWSNPKQCCYSFVAHCEFYTQDIKTVVLKIKVFYFFIYFLMFLFFPWE